MGESEIPLPIAVACRLVLQNILETIHRAVNTVFLMRSLLCSITSMATIRLCKTSGIEHVVYHGCSATLTTNCRVNPNCITVISSVPVAFSAVIAY